MPQLPFMNVSHPENLQFKTLLINPLSFVQVTTSFQYFQRKRLILKDKPNCIIYILFHIVPIAVKQNFIQRTPFPFTRFHFSNIFG